MEQFEPIMQKAVDEKITEIVQTLQARWEDRVNRRVCEANWAVTQSRIYDPEHALLKIYDAYRWVAEHVHLNVEILRNDRGASITMEATTDDGSKIDDFRSERIGECIADLNNQLNYTYF